MSPIERARRGRPPKEDRKLVRTSKIEFAVTEIEIMQIDHWAEEDGAPSRSAWIREQCGLSTEPREE